jgi:hypothetical protein
VRRWVLTALVVLTAAAPAHAAPRPLTRISGMSEFAPAGERVLVAHVGDASVRVDAIPVTGGEARPVFFFDVPEGVRLDHVSLAASAQRAAIAIKLVRSWRDNIGVTLVFAGPPGGGWSPLPPFTDPRATQDPLDVIGLQVEGERIITIGSRGEFDMHVVMHDPDPHEIPFASPDEGRSATFAGDFVAYRTGAPGELVEGRDAGDMLVVRNWRTGAVISSGDLHRDIGAIAVRRDGRAAASTEYTGELFELRPGAPARLLTRHGGSAVYAGDSLVYRPEDGLRVIDANGAIRRFGAPTASYARFATEGSRVLWEANGCLLVDDVTAPPAAAPAPGPCPRSELALGRQAALHPARVLPIALRCVAAPRACRGTLRLTADDRARHALSGRVRFSIPAGHARRLRVPLTRRGYARLRRQVARMGEATVGVNARTDDGERFPDGPALEGPGVLPRRR